MMMLMLMAVINIINYIDSDEDSGGDNKVQ